MHLLVFVGIINEPLDYVVAILIRCNVNEYHAGMTAGAVVANVLNKLLHKLLSTNSKCFLYDFGCKLVHGKLNTFVDNTLEGSLAIVVLFGMFQYMLYYPVSPLTFSDGNNVIENLIKNRTLFLLLLVDVGFVVIIII